jgi:hypothetical protein
VIVRRCSDGKLNCRGDAVVAVSFFLSLFAGFCGYEGWGYRFSICKRFCGSLFLIIVCLFVFFFVAFSVAGLGVRAVVLPQIFVIFEHLCVVFQFAVCR